MLKIEVGDLVDKSGFIGMIIKKSSRLRP